MTHPANPDSSPQSDPTAKQPVPLTAQEALICNCTITQAGNSYAINALQGMVSAASFYSYGNPNGSSANTGLEMSNTLIIFLYEDINTGIISLFLIADIANDGSGGSLQFDVNCLPSTAFVSVQDDAGEFFGTPPLISGDWSWGACCTDGGVIEDIGCNNTINLDYLISSGIDNIVWITGDINMPTLIPLDLGGADINISCGSGGICCPLSLDTQASVTDATCSDTPNGSIDLMPQDGIPPFSFNWSNGETTGTIDNLLPGVYDVTVSDSQGCTEELSINVGVSPGTPAAFPASLEVCSATGVGEFDLTSVEGDINGGTGFDVHWFENADMTGAINNPSNYAAGSTTVFAVVDNGSCLSLPVPVELTVIQSPIAYAASMNSCEVNNEQGLFDLTTLENGVSGGAGNVIWYTDPTLTNEIQDPEEFLSESTTIYAVVDDGTCISEPVEVQLIVDLKPEAFPAEMNLCGDDAFEAIFDLTLLDIQVSDGMGTVQWYTDIQLDDPIFNPAAFQTTTTIVYASVFDGVCYSDPAQVHLTVDPTAVGTPITIDLCDDGSSMALIDLTEYDFQVAGNQGAVAWYLDLFLTEPILDPMNFLTEATIIYATIDNGLCVSDPVPVTITLQMNVEGNPTSLSTCADTSGQGVFNLTLIDFVVSGGTGTVQWYEDAAGNFPIATPAAFTTIGATVYAQVSNGVCLSPLVPVELIIINTVTAISTLYDECGDAGVALFDLTTIEGVVSNNSGMVTWYYDSLGTLPINPTDSLPSGDTTIWARVTAGACASNTVPIDLVVLSTPQSTEVTLNLCGDTSATTTFDLTMLDTTISGNMGAVSWFSDSTLLTTLLSPNALLTGDTTVYAVVSNGGCLSDPATVVLNVSDGLFANPLTLNLCRPLGDTLFIDLLQSNTNIAGVYGVNWYLDSLETIPIGAPGSFPGVTTTTVWATATDGNCESEIVPVDLNILETPVAHIFTLSKCGQPGEQVLFDLVSIDSFIGEQTGNVSWYVDAALTNPIPNANSFLSNDSVVYALVSNGFCVTGPVAVTLDVTDSLLANAVLIQDCELNTNMATINLTTFNGAVNGGSGSVIWFTDSLTMDTIFNPLAYPTTGDTVYAVVSADGCISNVAAVPIQVASSAFPLPACDFTSIDSIAASWNTVTDEFSLTYSINGSIIGNNQLTLGNQFNLGGLGEGDTLKLWVTALFDSICTMPLTDSVICITDVCPARVFTFSNLASVYCRDDNPVNLSINPSGGQLSGEGLVGNVFTPSFVSGNSTQLTYQWMDIASGCAYDTTVNVEIQNPASTPLIDCTSPTLSSVTFVWPFEESSYGYSYSINSGTVVGPFQTSTSPLVFDGLNEGDAVELTIWSIGTAVCGNSDSVTISCVTKVCPPADINIDNPGLLCDDDDEILLGANVLGLPATPVPELRWYGSGIIDSLGVFDPLAAIPGNNAINAIVRQDGCVYIQPGNIVVTPRPDASLSIVGTPCVDSVLTISFNGITYPGTAEYWNFDFASTGSGSTGQDWEIWYKTPGDKHIAFGLDHMGCVDTFFTTLTIDAPLDPLILECIEEDYHSLMVNWQPVIGASQYIVTTSAGVGKINGTTYTITQLPDNLKVNINVTAIGESACGPVSASIECQTLEFIPPKLFIPNVFSPNDDGINDVFYLQANEYVTDINTFRIFDRWGNIVFEKFNFKPDDASIGWDGTFHDKLMNPDVFTYWVEYETVYGIMETKVGDVTLVR